MVPPVLAEADLVAEGLVAEFAGEGPAAAVAPAAVHLQAVRRGEQLVTLRTRVHRP